MALPRATYRLQLHRDFDFDAAAGLAPYLAQLGVSHVYSSPCLKARPGSRHGYDIVAHDEVNPELGGEAALARLVGALRVAGLGHVVDVVPNHMGVWGADNRLWLDVLAWGEESRYAGWFDIDWDPDRRYLQDKLLAPILGDQYGVELEAGHLELRFDATSGEFALWCYDVHKLPICPLHYESILGDEHYGLQELGDDFSALPEWRPQMAQRARELQGQLAALVAQDAEARAALQSALRRFNGEGGAGSRLSLHELIQRQHWRVTHFRVAGDDINYRRFFNVNELAGLRVELPGVFEHVHQLPLRWLAEGVADGLRIDHIDGLLDPPGYLDRLRAAMDVATAGHGASPGSVAARTADAPYLVVEKILAEGESLPADWPVDGTTGYEFGALVEAWLVDPSGQPALDALYERTVGGAPDWDAQVRASKLRIMDNEMAAELNVLARDASRVARQSAYTADFTRNILRRAIRAYIASLPVYRTYMRANGELPPAERERLQRAIDAASASEPELDPSVFRFLHRLLAGDLLGPRSPYTRHAVIRCARKLQQYSGPVMAKGLEDTALYRYGRLLALNDVGTDPQRFGLATAALHADNAARTTRTLLATSTHDTKWGEDARARLAVLSELPAAWADFCLAAFDTVNDLAGDAAGARADLYALLQRLVGSWPAEWTLGAVCAGDERIDDDARTAYETRLKEATTKALREAKLRSSWSLPRTAYEDGMNAGVERLLGWLQDPVAGASGRAFLARVATLGAHNSLAQLVLKLTAPGVPDIYQGCEGWNFSLMDPDNRRPVDFAARRRLLDEVLAHPLADDAQLQGELSQWQDGALKLRVTQRLLQHRRQHPELFERGGYMPLPVGGGGSDAVAAFARRTDRESLVVLVARFPARRAAQADVAGDMVLQLPDQALCGPYSCVLTGRRFTLDRLTPTAPLLRSMPMAVLHRA